MTKCWDDALSVMRKEMTNMKSSGLLLKLKT